MSEKLTVAVTSFELPPLTGWGGLGTYTHNLVHSLAELGHRVFCISCTPAPKRTVESVKNLTVIRIPRLERRFPILRQTLNSLLYARKVARELQRLERCEDLDIVQFPEYRGEGVVYLRRARRPALVRFAIPQFLVWDINFGDFASPVSNPVASPGPGPDQGPGGSCDPPGRTRRRAPLDQRLLRRFESEGIRRAKALLSPSASMAEVMRARVGVDKPVYVVPNGLEVDRFKPGSAPERRRELGIPEGAPVLLYVGRLEFRKGVHVLAEALAEVAREEPAAHFVLIGSDNDSAPGGGSMRTHVEARARALGYADRLHLLEPVPRDELPSVYALGDVFVAPSLYENFGNVNIEALASGLPVIGTEAGGPAEIVDHGENGLLVPPGDPGALARAALELLRDPQRRATMAVAAREAALARFDRLSMARATVAVYREILDGSEAE